jgi:HAE1 family hydrophobic/amphiphilic exporter-1
MWRFFVRRPTVAIVLSALIFLAGLVILFRLPIEQYPNVVPPQVQISASFVGADAVTVEESVAAPLEQQLSGVDRMIYMQSTGAADGTMSLRATFEVGMDPDLASVLTQNRVAQAMSRLPIVVQQTGVSVRTAFAAPLLVISLYSPDGTFDPEFLANYAAIHLTDRLLRVDGVGQVNVFGGANYAMRIWLDPTRLGQAGLTVADVTSAVQVQNDVHPAGQIGGAPSPPDQSFTYSVTTEGRLSTAEQFSEILLRTNPDGSQIRLGDVAKVELGSETYFQSGRYNGSPAVVMVVYQSPGSNALATATGVRATMTELAQRFPKDMRWAVSVDATRPVSEGIKEILETLLLALGLVILVVYLFLQNVRATLIPLLTVPVSLVGAFAFFPLAGFSINTLSLFGLVLAIGLVVDDAIVVVEAVERKIEAGLSPHDATLAAMDEVANPVIAVALILAAVFIPVAFAGGITGRLYQQFALTIAISVLLSALNALTLSPALCAKWLKPRKKSRGLLARFFARFDRLFDRTTNGYLRVVHVTTRRLVLSLLVLAAFVVATFLLGRQTKTGFVPSEDQGYLFANFSLPEAASLERTKAAMRRVEDLLAHTPGVNGYTAVAGYNILAGASAPYYGLVFIALDPWDERGPGEDLASIVAHLNQGIGRIPELQGVATPPPGIPGLGSTGGLSLYLQDLSGDLSPQALAEQVQRFVAAANERPELRNVLSPYRAGVPQKRAIVDEARALRQRLPLEQVYGTLATMLGGRFVNQFTRFGRTWNVYMQAERRFRATDEGIQLMYVRSLDGGMSPLSTVVGLEDSFGPQFMNRFNLFSAAYVLGDAAEGYSSGQAIAALEAVAARVLPKTMSYEWTDLSRQQVEAASVVPVFALALVAVFLILAALYESWSLPYAVLLGTPIAMAGAFLGLVARDLEFDVYGQIGLIMLVGLSAKNAILIVEYARSEYARGVPLLDAALDAGRLRLRPIIMTSFAFILGCVPLWVASGAGAQARKILGTVVIVGMLLSTLVATLIVPALFVLVERVVLRLRRRRPSNDDGGGEAHG